MNSKNSKSKSKHLSKNPSRKKALARKARVADDISTDEKSIDGFINQLTPKELFALGQDWELAARTEQLPPDGDWLTWLILGGRGAGKTRAGSEWVHDAAMAGNLMNNGSQPKLKYGRIALVAETLADAREVMVDGQSGILNIASRHRPVFETSRRRILWPNGAIAQIFSSEDPESLRGPQFDLAWCDELCKWRYCQETWDMLQFGLRLGSRPRQLVTTTPRPLELLKSIIADPLTAMTHMRTGDNRDNLASSFLQTVSNRYASTRLGRQELGGEIIEDQEGALWQRKQLEELRIKEPPELTRIVVAIDPPISAGAKNSCCGIVVAGVDKYGQAVVLEDGSIEGASPSQWAAQAVRLYHEFEADMVVAEVNQGGDMVRSVLQASEASLPIQMVRATRGKWLRAEPIAALYEQGKVAHLAGFSKLEDQMCNFVATGGQSPDRLDALVWALTALMLNGAGAPAIRTI